MYRLLCLLVCVATSVGCRTSTPPHTHLDAPAYTVRFPSADSLMAYLPTATTTRALLSAHRGGPMPGYPENAIETFQHSLRYTPALIECDVQLSADSVLFMLHDDKLDRTTTATGIAGQRTWIELQRITLRDPQGQPTSYTIPSLQQVLAWSEGRAVLTVDPKRPTPLANIIRDIQRAKAHNRALLITYNINQAEEAHRLDSTLLLSVSIGNVDTWARYKSSRVRLNRVVAFVGTREPDAALYDTLRKYNIPAMLGTLGNLDKQAAAITPTGIRTRYQDWRKHGAGLMSTDSLPAAAAALGWVPKN